MPEEMLDRAEQIRTEPPLHSIRAGNGVSLQNALEEFVRQLTRGIRIPPFASEKDQHGRVIGSAQRPQRVAAFIRRLLGPRHLCPPGRMKAARLKRAVGRWRKE